MGTVDWKRKLTSRKFWLSVAAFVSMLLVFLGKDRSVAEGVAALIMAGASVIGYAIGEGLADSGYIDVSGLAAEETPEDHPPRVGFIYDGPEEDTADYE